MIHQFSCLQMLSSFSLVAPSELQRPQGTMSDDAQFKVIEARSARGIVRTRFDVNADREESRLTVSKSGALRTEFFADNRDLCFQIVLTPRAGGATLKATTYGGKDHSQIYRLKGSDEAIQFICWMQKRFYEPGEYCVSAGDWTTVSYKHGKTSTETTVDLKVGLEHSMLNVTCGQDVVTSDTFLLRNCRASYKASVLLHKPLRPVKNKTYEVERALVRA